ncbi:hypothetical protein AB0D74_36525 [Streptomyces sp. NPDC048278]|uniref:hypothetical protein n=1 Tax=Streptomyces sp. NPDC048278 TaxID=3155809 RepID=UPI003424D821
MWTRATGTHVSAPPHAGIDDRIAHWIVTGPTAEACTRRRALVTDHVSVHISRPAHTTTCTT